jgi:hypothetical protein
LDQEKRLTFEEAENIDERSGLSAHLLSFFPVLFVSLGLGKVEIKRIVTVEITLERRSTFEPFETDLLGSK